MDGFFPRLGAGVARFHWLVIGLWLALFVAAIPLVKNLTGALKSGGFEVADSDSGRGARILEDEFGRRTVTTGVMIFAADNLTVDDPRYRQAVTSSIDRVKNVDGVSDVFSFYSTQNTRFVSQDRKSTYAIVNFVSDEEKAKKITPDVRKELENQPDGITARLMGFPALSYDLAKGSEHDLKKAELTSLPLTLLLLLLVFGSILAAGLPLILGAAAVLISLAGIYLLAQKMEVSIFAMNTASMIGLGLGIDFSLLMVSRFREELDKGLTPYEATINTVATSGRSIVFSGLTVMLGLAVLVAYELVLIRSIAMGMLLVAGVATLGAVTLLPALMAMFGRKINAFRLFGRRKKAQAVAPTRGGKWHNWSLMVMRRPWVFLILSLGILLALAYPAKDFYAIGSGGARGMPKESETGKAFAMLLDAFGPGEATPISVVVRADRENGAWDPAMLEGVYRLVKKIEADPRVQRVESLVGLMPPGTTEEQFKAINPQQLLANPQAQATVPAVVNVPRPNEATRRRADTHSVVIYARQDELNQDSIDLVKELRSTIVPSVTLPRGTETPVTGQTALILDYRDKLFSQFPLLVGAVLLVTYVVLLMFFQSLILPLKAILMNIVAILASYGVLTLVFQKGFGDDLLGFESLGRISMFAPVILFSILFGLSTDYEVFLLSRVKELYHGMHLTEPRTANEHSVAEGLEHTAGIITAAGLIMIVVFGSFALGDTLVIKELGVGLAIAVFLDSTIIRVMMVPASMKLMGDLNWWMPAWLKKIIPAIEESAEAPIKPRGYVPPMAVQQAAMGHNGYQPCPVCRTPTRPNARFCGRCGANIAATAPQPVPVGVGAGPGETATDWRVQPQVQVGPQVPAGQAGVAGVRRVPVLLTDGRQQQRAWLVLRDCHVEDDPRRSGLPTLQINGLDLAGLSGTEPEIQIRNARVRL